MTLHLPTFPAPVRPWSRRWAAALAFPRDGLARVRWVCLLLALAPAALLAARLALAGATAWPLRAAALAALAGLGAWWFQGYRRGSFPPGGLVLEGFALLVIGLAGGPGALGLSYGGVYFRALYAPGWRVVAVWLAFAGAHLGALALGTFSTAALLHPFNWAIIAGMTGGLAAALAERQRAVADLRGVAARAVPALARRDHPAGGLAGRGRPA